MATDVDPISLDIKGSTQPAIFQATVDAMAQELQIDAAKFWQDTLTDDGPIEIWEISAERFLYNGNQCYQAAVQTSVNIPAAAIKIVDRTGSQIATFFLKDLMWL